MQHKVRLHTFLDLSPAHAELQIGQRIFSIHPYSPPCQEHPSTSVSILADLSYNNSNIFLLIFYLRVSGWEHLWRPQND